MEPNDEVLVVIQAESGEEIALPLTALGEQHQEVVVDSDGITTIVSSNNENNEAQTFATTNGYQINGETHSGDNVKPMIIASPQTTPVKKPQEPRIKQKRKEKLVCLPLFEDDLTLEFQTVEYHSPPAIEEPKKRPRKEYRTKKRLAALEPPKEQTTCPTPTSSPPPPPAATTDSHQQPSPSSQPPVQATSERRTRLSNACRVATGKMYKCNDCQFSTERINNIIIHMKETCPKIKREKSA